jgi:hypothetical protein
MLPRFQGIGLRLTTLPILSMLFASLLIVVGYSGARAQTGAAHLIYDSGFYEVERLKDENWRWMSEEGTIKLKNAKQDMVLRFAGRAPLDSMPEAPVMKVNLNGVRLDQFTPVDKIFEKEYLIPAAKLGNDEWSELRITTSKVVVPSKVNKTSKDDRHLGFKLYKLTWSAASGAPIVEHEEPAPESKSWLIAGLIFGLLIALTLAAALGVWIYLLKRRLAGSKILYNCAECAEKAKAASGGKKVPCSACGKTVLVPKAKAGDK